MRYLHITKSGTWYFRYQLSPTLRPLFNNRYEIKKSLRTSCKIEARLLALQLELDIRTVITNNLQGTKPAIQLSIHPIDIHKTIKVKKRLTPLECLEQYRISKSDHVSLKTLEGNYAKCNTVLSLLNKRYLSEVRRIEADEIKRLLYTYPSNARKHQAFKGLNALEIIEANKEVKLPTLSPESVRSYIHKSSSFFEWCVQMELTDINPFTGFKFKATKKVSEEKQHYSDCDLKLIFGTEIHRQQEYLHPHYYWLPLLGYLTGARLNELCQLYRSDIINLDGHWLLSINDKKDDQKLKTPFSQRLIPIHNFLIELGFLDYINTIDSGRIFPELQLTRDGYGAGASKWFGRFKQKQGFKRGKDFHSFRHSFANNLKQQVVPQVLAAGLLGHSQQGITYDRYGKDLDVSLLVQVVQNIPVLSLKNVMPFKNNNG